MISFFRLALFELAPVADDRIFLVKHFHIQLQPHIRLEVRVCQLKIFAKTKDCEAQMLCFVCCGHFMNCGRALELFSLIYQSAFSIK